MNEGKVHKINEIARQDRSLSNRMIDDMVMVGQTLYGELHITRVCAKMVPINLTQAQKYNRKNICSDIMELLTWKQSVNRCTGRPSLRTKKKTAYLFFDIQGTEQYLSSCKKELERKERIYAGTCHGFSTRITPHSVTHF